MKKSITLSIALLALLSIVLSSSETGLSQESSPKRSPQQKGFTFKQFSQRHDDNKDGKISLDEFKGAKQAFKRLDKNGDDIVTEAEFKVLIGRNETRVSGRGRKVPEGVKAMLDLEYAKVDRQSLKLDLFLPKTSKTKPPLLVWIHGGGWTKGSKTQFNPAFLRLTAEGFATASIDYRLTGLNSHPKQIHDCKGAVRWLRANADKYGYDAKRIAVGGGSAGGHLALLLGLSGGVKELEGTVGGNLDQSSKIHAIVDLFGPSELDLFAKEFKQFGYNKTPELLKYASPLTYLGNDDPPVIIFYGDQDKVVPPSQNEEVHKRYQKAGLDSSIHLIKGAGHGGMEFSDTTRYALIKKFVERHIGTKQ